MEATLTPFNPNGFNGFMVADELGYSPVGRLLNVEWEEIDRKLYFSFDYEIDSDLESSDAALFIIRNGAYLTRLTNGETTWVFRPLADSTFENFEFFLAPNDEGWASLIDVVAITNTVKLSFVSNGLDWVAGGDAKKLIVKHCYGSGTPDTTLATLSRIGATLISETGSMGGIMHTAGRWEEPDILWTTIAIKITTAGIVDTAEYEWTWRTWSGSGICRSYPDHIINGVKVWFEPDYTYEYDEDWTIYVCLPTEYTTKRLTTGGTSTFGIDSENSAGDQASGPTVEVDLYIPPEAPAITGTPAYVEGSGEIEITWTAPTAGSSPLASYRVYRNWPHKGARNVDWAWEYSDTATAETPFVVTVTGLEEGFNRIQATVVDSGGLESALSQPWEVTLNSSLTSMADTPNSPDSISARMLASGNIEVTVIADSTSDRIYLYHDAHSGTINYGTVITTVDNPRAGLFQELTATLTGLSDGLYLIGARARLAGAAEENTDVICSVLRDKDIPAAVVSLTAEVLV